MDNEGGRNESGIILGDENAKNVLDKRGCI